MRVDIYKGFQENKRCARHVDVRRAKCVASPLRIGPVRVAANLRKTVPVSRRKPGSASSQTIDY